MPSKDPYHGRSDTPNAYHTDGGGPIAAPVDHVTPEARRNDVTQGMGDAMAFAEVIKRAGMAGPASIALRIGGPLAWIGGQMLWALQPLLEGLMVGAGSNCKSQGAMVPRLARFLEGEGNVAALVAQLESQPTFGSEGKRGPSSSGGEADGPF